MKPYWMSKMYQAGAWDTFERFSSIWYGQQMYFKQRDGSVYSRYSGKYMSFEDAVYEFLCCLEDE